MEGGFVVFAARASRVRAHQGSWQSCRRTFALEGRVREWEGPRSGASRPERREGASSVEARAHGRHREAHRLLGCSAKCSEGQSASFCFQFQGEPICGPRSQEPLVPVLKKTQARTKMAVLPCPPVRAVHLRAPGALGIVNSGLIPSLVWKLQREEEEIQALLLDTLAACLTEDATEALASRAVPFLKEKLLSADGDIRSKAARTLIAVSVPLEGKVQVWQHDAIPILVHLLKDRDEEVQANAAGALMNAAVTTEGKYAALDVEATRPLLQLLTSSLSKARLNAIKALTMLAEAPEGRKLLQPHVATFRVLEEDFSPAVQRAAQIAIKVIEWKP
ncbi:radial spoke head 14 homolog isoform X2 [Oryx dammah]|uniref:radial spoke head 14 homolog isoform X2 n=1 Tax=Oryx dammah TaxID=59534 RepID=UPI001A9B4B51|nr:radial spoke head 14 homolog isoform X2 [Oryx dammah]